MKVSVTASHPYDMDIVWADMEKRMTGSFQFISQSSLDSIAQNRFLTEQRTILVTTLDTGWLTFPPVTVYHRNHRETWDSTSSPALYTYVSTVNVDMAQGFKPLKPPLGFYKPNFLRWHYLVIMGITGTFLAFLLYRKIKKERLQRLLRKKLIPPKSPHDRAMEALKQLDAEQLWQHGHVMDYYGRITYILREYLETGLKIQALENTSAEILRSLKKRSSRNGILDRLSRDLRTADYVKFAKAQPLPEEHQQIMETVIQFVKETNPEKGTTPANPD